MGFRIRDTGLLLGKTGRVLRIYDMVLSELERCRTECNFTPIEQEFFEIRSRGKTLEECAEDMNISLSTAKRIHRKVKIKIARA